MRKAGQTASVDDLITSLRPLGRPIGPAPVPDAGPAGLRRRSRLRPIRPPMGVWTVRACVGLGVLLGAAMTQWPYARACGWGLIFYLLAVTLLVVAGIWGLLLSWKSRLGFTHAIAMGTLLWGFVLSAEVVLPRVGYAANHATWTCQR